MSNTSVATSNEWHAPDSFIFDYAGPGVVKTDILELAREFLIVLVYFSRTSFKG